MATKSPMKKFIVIVGVLVAVGFLLRWGFSDFMGNSDDEVITAKNTILHLDMRGVILNGKKFIKNLKKYQEDEHVKAIVVEINSPGGAVGASQALYEALKHVRDNLKKPVVCVSSGIVASGSYYASLGCNSLIVAPGSLIGSIGVIMEFANLEKLYDWAKISRFTITSGKYKDSGAEFREMREDEKLLFQSMIDEVYQQFRMAVKTERKLSDEVLDQYADGRVFTGATAVKAGFADAVGLYDQAVEKAAELAGLGKDYKIFEIPPRKTTIFDLGSGEEEDPINSVTDLADLVVKKKEWSAEAIKTLLRTEYLNQPLYLMPGTW